MKFLLAVVNAKYIHSNPAIYSLRAYSVQKDSELEKHIELAEYTINQPFQDILADIYARMPDCVAFSCYIWNIGMVKDIVRELAKILPETRIWLGGPEVSYNAEELLEEMPFITGIMVGEGEVTFHELLMFYRQGGPEDIRGLEQTDGIVFRKRGQEGICRTRDRALTDISRLPFFYNEADIGDFHNRILYYESSRGCPYRCSYCLS